MPTVVFSLIQTSTHWHDPAANREHFDSVFDQLPAHSDVVVLPEMFSTGFTMESSKQAEASDGETIAWLRRRSAELNKVICGSLSMRPQDRAQPVNRFVWVQPDGGLEYYDKRHRFRMAGEHDHYAAGLERKVIVFRGLRILPFVCYDLRFPVWLRCRGDYDLLLGVANWPAARQQAWDTLLRARAIENLAFCIGVNVIGRDGGGIAYSGGSAAYDPQGTELLQAGDADGVFTLEVDTERVEKFRDSFPAWQDSDDFVLGKDRV